VLCDGLTEIKSQCGLVNGLNSGHFIFSPFSHLGEGQVMKEISPSSSLSQRERIIKQKSYGRVHRSLYNKNKVDLWTVIRRTAIREFSSSIWNDEKGGAEDQ